MAYLYLLHFDDPYHHARHYLGITGNLRQRLTSHAVGDAARLTEVLEENDLHWTLSGLWLIQEAQEHRIERLIKNRNNGPRLCPVCNPKAKCPPACTPYDLHLIPFPTDSRSLRKDDHKPELSQTARFGPDPDRPGPETTPHP
jgi:predicted GIY-YIG superfamily endonuclease